TSGQGQPADFAVDTVAPSAPVLKAEDDGSVSVELPGDANKGDLYVYQRNRCVQPVSLQGRDHRPDPENGGV
ncbi:hypothetical protein E2K72_26150, partial [Escherichia coli]